MSHTLPISPHIAKDLVSYQEGSIVSREIVKSVKTTVTIFAFAQGQGLSEHTTPFTAVAHIIDGEAEITVGGEKHTVTEGQLIIMPANSPHALQAHQPFTMILTMARETE